LRYFRNTSTLIQNTVLRKPYTDQKTNVSNPAIQQNTYNFLTYFIHAKGSRRQPKYEKLTTPALEFTHDHTFTCTIAKIPVVYPTAFKYLLIPMFPQLGYHCYPHTIPQLINVFIHLIDLKAQKVHFWLAVLCRYHPQPLRNTLTILVTQLCMYKRDGGIVYSSSPHRQHLLLSTL